MAVLGIPLKATGEDMLMIDPPRSGSMCRSRAWQPQTDDLKPAPSMRSTVSSVTSSMGSYFRDMALLTTLTRTLAAELGPRRVRVNAVAPGSVPTPATAGFVDEAEYERRARTIPLRRLGQTGDNNQAVAFLLSREASFITGTVLHVDGGIVAAG